MAADERENFMAKDPAFSQTPRREPTVIEGKAEPEGEPEPQSADDHAGTQSGPPAGPGLASQQKKAWGLALPLSILLGAVLAVGGAVGLHYLDDAPQAVAQLEDRLNQLNEKTDALATTDDVSAQNQALEGKITALEAEIGKARQTSREDVAGSLEALAKRIAAIEYSTAAASGATASLRTTVQKLLDTQKVPAERSAAEAITAPLAEFEKRVGALEATVTAASKANASLRADLQKSIDAQKALTEKPPAPVQVNLAPLDTRLTKIEQRLTPVETALSAAKTDQADVASLDTRLAKIEQRLTPVETALATTTADIKAVQEKEAMPKESPAQDQTLAIMAINLVQKVQQGLPYEKELAALANTNVDPAKLSALKTFAASGVAPSRKLADQFEDIAPALLKLADKTSSDQSFIDRLAEGASHLVRIERVGEQQGTDDRSLVGRIEAALSRNDVPLAFTLWNQLSPGAKTLSSAFGEAAKARIEVIEASWAIESAAIANLSKQKS